MTAIKGDVSARLWLVDCRYHGLGVAVKALGTI